MISLAGWEGKLISSSDDSTIRVWELETRGLDATLTGHGGRVCALLVHGKRLFSASRDGSILAWERGRWWRAWTRTKSRLRDSIRDAWRRADRSSSAGLGEDQLTFSTRCWCGSLWDLDSLKRAHGAAAGGGDRVVPGCGGRGGVGTGVDGGGGVGAGLSLRRRRWMREGGTPCSGGCG